MPTVMGIMQPNGGEGWSSTGTPRRLKCPAAEKNCKQKAAARRLFCVLILYSLPHSTPSQQCRHEVALHRVEELVLAFEVIDHLLLPVDVLPAQVRRTSGIRASLTLGSRIELRPTPQLLGKLPPLVARQYDCRLEHFQRLKLARPLEGVWGAVVLAQHREVLA